jgi:hypothetical protein
MDFDKAKLVIGGSRGRVGYGHAPDHMYGDMPYDSALSPRTGHHSPRMSPVSHPRHAIGPPPHTMHPQGINNLLK